MQKKLLPIPEVAQVLDVPAPRVYDLVRQGILPGVVRLGRQIKVDQDQLWEFIERGGQALPGGWKKEK